MVPALSLQNTNEAEEVVKLVKVLVDHGGHGQETINVLTFYNGQRSLIARMLTKVHALLRAALRLDRGLPCVLVWCNALMRGSGT